MKDINKNISRYVFFLLLSFVALFTSLTSEFHNFLGNILLLLVIFIILFLQLFSFYPKDTVWNWFKDLGNIHSEKRAWNYIWIIILLCIFIYDIVKLIY